MVAGRCASLRAAHSRSLRRKRSQQSKELGSKLAGPKHRTGRRRQVSEALGDRRQDILRRWSWPQANTVSGRILASRRQSPTAHDRRNGAYNRAVKGDRNTNSAFHRADVSCDSNSIPECVRSCSAQVRCDRPGSRTSQPSTWLWLHSRCRS